MEIRRILAIFDRYCIVDFIIVIVFIITSILIETSNISKNLTPYISSDINNPLRLDLNYNDSLFLLLPAVTFIIILFMMLTKRNDFTVLKLVTTYLFSISFSYFVALAFQRLILRPRPDTISRCGSIEGCQSQLTPEDFTIQFTSLPSKNSAFTAAAAAFTYFFLDKFWHSTLMFSVLLKFLPILMPLLIGSDEIIRRFSHVDDVLMGYLIGFIIGSISFQAFREVVEVAEKFETMKTANVDSITFNPTGL